MPKAKRPAKRNVKKNVSETAVFSRSAGGILVIGLGLLAFACLIMPSNATAIFWTRGAIQGLMGHLRFFLPIVLCWAGVLLTFSARARVRVSSILLISLLILCAATLMQVFQYKRLMQELALEGYLQSYKNFLWKAYAASEKVPVGGGVLGAFLAWPLTKAFDTWGAFLVLLFVVGADVVCLMGISMPQVGERTLAWTRERIDIWREDREARRLEEEEWLAQQEMEAEAALAKEEPPHPKVNTRKRKPLPPVAPPLEEEYEEDYQEEEPPHIAKPAPRAMTRLDAKADVHAAPGMNPSQPGAKQVGEGIFIENMEDYTPTADAYSDLDIERAKKRQRDAQNPRPRRRTKDELPDFLAKKRDSFTTFDVLPDHMKPPADKEQEAQAAPILEMPMPRNDAPEHKDTQGERLEAPQEDCLTEDDLPPWETLEDTYTPDIAAPRYEPVSMDRIPELDPADRLDMTPMKLKEEPAPDVEEMIHAYRRPPYELLNQPDSNARVDTRELDAENARKLEETLLSFNVTAHVLNVTHGPAITRFELQPAPGVKVSRIVNLTDDIALNMAANAGVRIEAPIPGKAAVGIEIPNDSVSTVLLREVLESEEARRNSSKLAVALGKDIAGKRIIADIARMPHVLIAGATGSGKSVCINTIITSIIYRTTPEEVRMILIDPKVVELSVYNGIPHLLVPVVTDPKKASGALGWAVMEMEDRYKRFAKQGVREIRSYNAARGPEDPLMPQIVIIIDELADLMLVAPGEVEDLICRIAQLARAAGIHLVIATQRPSVNVITGVIKANIPSRIAFAVSSQVDSRTILDSAGAEKLLGKGDMLYAPSGGGKPLRVQGCFVSDDEVKNVVEFVKERHDTTYDEHIIEHINSGEESAPDEDANESEYDELLAQAVEMSVESGQASISMLQRRLRVGYARAGRLIDEMARRNIIGQAEGAKPRQVLITREDYQKLFPGA